jgi:hypothetical protein
MMARIEAEPLGEGERVERAKRRRRLWLFAALFAAGFPCGVYLGYILAANDYDLAAPWNPTIALAITALFLLAMTVGSILLAKQIDEVERANQSKAAAVAGSVYVVLYPTWFFLWKGGFAPEPIHWALFIAFWLVLVGAALYYRFR